MSRVRNLLLLALLAVCALSFWWARREPDRDPRPALVTPQSSAQSAAVEATLLSVHVAVLNGTGEAGLARRFSRLMPELGCVVVEMADAPHDTFSRSLLISRRLGAAQARQLADGLGGVTVIQEWDARCREDAVLVLGRDHERLQAALARR